MGRPRFRRNAARGAGPARAALLAPPAANVHACPRARAARRRLGRRHGRDGRRAGARLRARAAARPSAVRAGRRGAAALPRGRGDRVELPGHAARRGLGALYRCRRDEERDATLAEQAGVDVLFAPAAEEIYPDGFQTWVDVEEVGSILEGEYRPGHFRGVATVCLKLFNLVRPARAYFGQKDAQQVAVIKRMVRDLAVPVEIRVCPTIRDEDGLALSSRNAYLSPEERERG